MYGQRLKELRKEKGMTIEQVAQWIGIAKSSYASYEKKYRQPPLDKLLLLSDLYSVSVDYIVGKTTSRFNYEGCTDAKHFLSQKGLNWNGVTLSETELDYIQKKLEEIIADKIQYIDKEGS